MLFQTFWSLSSRRITKNFQRRRLETKFHNCVEYGKAQAQQWHWFYVSVQPVLLLTSESDNYLSPFLSVATSPNSVVHTNLYLDCPLINVTYFYPEHIHLNRLEVCDVSLGSEKGHVCPRFCDFFSSCIVYPIRINYLCFQTLPLKIVLGNSC